MKSKKIPAPKLDLRYLDDMGDFYDKIDVDTLKHLLSDETPTASSWDTSWEIEDMKVVIRIGRLQLQIYDKNSELDKMIN